MEYPLSRIIQPFRGQVISSLRFVLGALFFVSICAGCHSSNLLGPPSSYPPPRNRSITPLPTPTVLSIFPFEDRTLKPELAWLRTGLVDMLVGELAGHPSLVVVQRERVDEVIREQALQVSGRVSDHSMVKIGQLIGANVVLTGRVLAVGDHLLIHAQFVSVEQGAVLGAVAAEGPMREAANVARDLVEKVRALLPTGESDAAPLPSFGAPRNNTAQPSDERRSREDKLFEALKESERAHALNQPAQPSLNLPLHTVPSMKAVSEGASAKTDSVDRLLERFMMGLEAEIGTPFYEATSRGRALTVPVSIRFSSRVDEAIRAVNAMPGVMQQMEEQHDIRFVMPATASASSMIQQATPARRFYLRLLSGDGRTIAVYSDFKAWHVSNWIATDKSAIHIRREHVLTGEAKFPSLTSEQIAAISSARMTLDRVPEERATVRIDVQMISDQFLSSSSEPPNSDIQAARRDGMTKQDAAFSTSVAPLRTLIEEVWAPPVYERAWMRGYTPSNERTAIIIGLLDPIGRQIIEAPRLARPSGEDDFDQAALSALNTVLTPWLSAQGFDSLTLPNIATHNPAEMPARRQPFIKLRAQFRLHKDIPALNLFGPESLDSTIQHPTFQGTP